MEKALVVVCARGGSSLPKKNLAEIAGNPLLAITHESVKLPEEAFTVIFSTDDEEIAKYARELGFWVPFLRPPEFALGESPIEDALIHAAEIAENQYGIDFNSVVCIQNSSLFRYPQDIINCVEILSKNGSADGAMTVHQAEHEHPDKVYIIAEPNVVKHHQPALNPYRRQDLRPVFYHNGLCYVVRKKYLLTYRRLIPFTHSLYVETERWRAMDIHTDQDIKIASALYPVFQEWKGENHGKIQIIGGKLL